MKGHLLIVLLLTVTACRPETGSLAGEKTPPTVVVEAANRESIDDTIVLHGVIAPLEDTMLAVGTGGRVDKVAVDEGDHVKAGQTLAYIGSALASARYKQAESGLASAKASYERTKSLAAQNLVSPAALEQATTNYDQAEAAYEMARSGLNDAYLKSPHQGIVAERRIAAGEFAAPGAPLLRVVDTHEVEVVGQLAERDLPFVQLGREASVRVDALSDRELVGKVTRLGAVADTTSRTFDVEVTIANADGALRPGMMCRISLSRQTLEDVVVVRRDAISEGFADRAVFVVNSDDVAERVPVTLGPVQGERVAVTRGLRGGERVVVAGHRFLVNGQKVKPTSPSAGAAPIADVKDASAVGGTAQ